jgi:cupin superfamily acireductone dioxygenase involved in methionine salvage
MGPTLHHKHLASIVSTEVVLEASFSIMRAYFYDTSLDTDPREPHEHAHAPAVTLEQLAVLGVLYWHIPIQGDYMSHINQICTERHYQNRDEVGLVYLDG